MSHHHAEDILDKAIQQVFDKASVLVLDGSIPTKDGELDNEAKERVEGHMREAHQAMQAFERCCDDVLFQLRIQADALKNKEQQQLNNNIATNN